MDSFNKKGFTKKNQRSVSDNKNYGDVPDVYGLLYPNPETIRGVYDEDFV